MPRSLPNPRRVVPFKGPNDEFIIGRVLKRALMGIARARIAVFDKRRVVSMWRGTLVSFGRTRDVLTIGRFGDAGLERPGNFEHSA